MAWLKNFKTKRAIPASQLKWADDDADTTSVADHITSLESQSIDRSAIVNIVYPVGSIYMSVNNTSPATLFGGTWVQMKNQFLIGAGGTYSLGSTGGEATHRLTIAEMPSHNHLATSSGKVVNISSGSGYTIPVANDYGSTSSIYTGSTGGGGAHNNMPPYIAVNIWKRTA